VKSVKIAELKNNLSRLLAYVRRGGTVRVFDRDKPVADLIPCKPPISTNDAEAWLASLERDGALKRATRRLPANFLRRRLPRARKSVVRALLDEREGNR
jgi:antitoxin (DNA-binding transcriptional repressor) of toxin-antitoxin stability system